MSGPIQPAPRQASTPLEGLIRQFLRMVIGLAFGLIGGLGIAGLGPEQLEAIRGELVGVLTALALPVLAALGKKLRDSGNPLGELF